MNQSTVGILIFDGVEVLDFAGPYEVFSRTRLEPGVESRRSDESAPFRVFTVAARADAVVATGGLRVLPDFDLAAAPGIVRAHRGAFIVNSKPKQGTTIRALLPLRETEPVEGPSTLS